MCKYIFAVLESVTDDSGNYIPVIVVEGEDHYHKTDWQWGKDLTIARACAQERNDYLGISKDEAQAILIRSMFGHA